MKSKSLLMLLSLFTLSFASYGQNRYNLIEGEETRIPEVVQPRKQVRVSKAIVIFFSHAGDNYKVGHVDVGNTKVVADYISECTGASQWEIVTNKYDDMPYNHLVRVAREEAEKSEFPPYEGKIPPLAKYDTVFIGGPVWWGTYPRVMFTFLNDADLEGKTIIPFTTHEGSGLASCVSDLRKRLTKSNVSGSAFSIAGHEVGEGRSQVEQWLKTLGY